jgi:hypothetical protein
LHFGLAQLAVASLGQTLEFEPTDAGAGEALDLKTQLIEHEADLSLEALLKHHMTTMWSDEPGALGPSLALFGEHAAGQLGHGFHIHGLVHHHLVLLFRSHARVHEAMGEFTLIGQQKQALAFLVQTPHMMQGLILPGQQGIDGHAVPLIAAAADIAFGLVQGENHSGPSANDSAVHLNFIIVLHQGAEFTNGLAVDADTAFADDLFAAAPRTEAALT